MHGDVLPQAFSALQCDRIVQQPVFLLPLLSFYDFGHLLTDILEPLYYAMKTMYKGG